MLISHLHNNIICGGIYFWKFHHRNAEESDLVTLVNLLYNCDYEIKVWEIFIR